MIRPLDQGGVVGGALVEAPLISGGTGAGAGGMPVPVRAELECPVPVQCRCWNARSRRCGWELLLDEAAALDVSCWDVAGEIDG